jgi:hypothetical protein
MEAETLLMRALDTWEGLEREQAFAERWQETAVEMDRERRDT